MIRLTRAGFRRWLVNNGGKIVGISTAPCGCPIHGYLTSRGAKNVTIGISSRNADGRIHQHNKWQRRFQIEAIALERQLKVQGLRGREALSILDRV